MIHYKCVYIEQDVYVNSERMPPGWCIYPVKSYRNPDSFLMNEIVFLKGWCENNLFGTWRLSHNVLYIQSIEDITLLKLSL